MFTRSFVSATMVTALVFGVVTPAFAQDAEADKVAEARSHYEQGIKLYDQKDYDAARAEFERAYAIAPSYRILYNIALVQRRKSDYVGALRNFELYLSEAGSSIPDVRRKQVEQELSELHALVASVTITTNVPGADILVDDVAVGKSPLKEPVLVNPGQRKIGAAMAGRIPAAKVIQVVGKDNLQVALELQQSRQVIMLEKPSRRVPWVGWGVTAALTAGAVTTGILALNASNSLQDRRDAPNADPEQLDTYSSRARTLGIATDVLTGAAVVAAGVSLYFTLKWNSEHNREMEQWEKNVKPSEPKISWSPTGVMGTF